MYLEHFGLKRNPFPTTPNLDFFYNGGSRSEAIEAIHFALEKNFGIIKVLGSVGTGKTMICRKAHRILSEQYDVLFISDPSLESGESIISAVANELNPEWDLSKPKSKIFNQVIQTLIQHKNNHKESVLFIEEAQKLTQDQLEELRYLTNLETSQDKLLQIVLFGQPTLDAILLKSDAQLLSSRLTHSIFIKPLTFSEFKEYVELRLSIAGLPKEETLFTHWQLWVIYQVSNHSLRYANQLLEKALFSAFIRKSYTISIKDIATSVANIGNPGAGMKYTRAQLASVFSLGVFIGWLGFTATQPLMFAPAISQNIDTSSPTLIHSNKETQPGLTHTKKPLKASEEDHETLKTEKS